MHEYRTDELVQFKDTNVSTNRLHNSQNTSNGGLDSFGFVNYLVINIKRTLTDYNNWYNWKKHLDLSMCSPDHSNS